MNLSVGIVGLPNVGKSTLFNALLKKQQALVANYPFATIEPNIGIVPVPDQRLTVLADIVERDSSTSLGMIKRPPIKPATVEFVDIAGLVKGAAEGAGLGNKFLSHIREVSVIVHVVRGFSDENIIKEGSVDPKSDYQTIQTELMLADLATVEKIVSAKGKRQADTRTSAAEKLFKGLGEGKPARDVLLTKEEQEVSKEFCLLSAKPEIIVINVSEGDYTAEKIPQIIEKYSIMLSHSGKPEAHPESKQIDPGQRAQLSQARMTNTMVVICAKIESELAELSEEEQRDYLKDLGLEQSGLERLIKKAYETLGLISFLTAGEKEVKAWTIRLGETSLMAAGHIHTDFMQKFIKAEVVSFADFVQYKGWKGCREKGKARFEGRDYVMQDGDVVEFLIGS